MPMTHAPETGTENPYHETCMVFCRCVRRIGIDFFWYRNLVRSRTMFYSVQETVTKMMRTDWSDDRQLCFFVYISCVVFYFIALKWIGDSSIEKLIQKFCFQFHLVRKKLCPKNGTSFLVGYRFFGTGFWCVCHWHYLILITLINMPNHVVYCHEPFKYRYVVVSGVHCAQW